MKTNPTVSDKQDDIKNAMETINDTNIKIQINRVLYVIDRLKQRIHLLAYLPYMLLNDGEILKAYVSPKNFQFIIKVCQLYLENRNKLKFRTSLEYSKLLCDLKMLNTSISSPITQKFEPHSAQLSDILYNNLALIELIQSLPLNHPHVMKNLLQLSQEIANLIPIIEQKLSSNVKEEEELKVAYKQGLEQDKIIEYLKEQLNNQASQTGTELALKTEKLALYKRLDWEQRKEFVNKILDITYESERMMMNDTLQSEERQTILAATAKESKIAYHTLLESNLEEEKNIRGVRNKIEANLASWIAKFDTDITEKQNEFETLKAEYDSEFAAMEELQRKFQLQEIEYNALMKEKKDEDERNFQEKYWNFVSERAARVIQGYWRRYKELRKLKRKTKKGKKGNR